MLRFGGPAVPQVRLRFSNETAAARYGFRGPDAQQLNKKNIVVAV
jgi:hypothetical protein